MGTIEVFANLQKDYEKMKKEVARLRTRLVDAQKDRDYYKKIVEKHNGGANKTELDHYKLENAKLQTELNQEKRRIREIAKVVKKYL